MRIGRLSLFALFFSVTCLSISNQAQNRNKAANPARRISLLTQPIGGLNAHRSPVSLRSVFFCYLPVDFKSGTKPQRRATPRKARRRHAIDRRREALPDSLRGAEQQRSYRS